MAARYRMATPVAFYWTGIEGRMQESSGMTRDISTAGVFVESSACPPQGALIGLEIRLPDFALQLNFEGRVLRVEAEDDRQGFAVGGFLYLSD